MTRSSGPNDDGQVRATCVLCVSRFPRLSSVFISNSIPRPLNLDIPRLKQRRRVMWESSTPEYERNEIRAMDFHAAFVFQTLAAANVRLEEGHR